MKVVDRTCLRCETRWTISEEEAKAKKPRRFTYNELVWAGGRGRARKRRGEASARLVVNATCPGCGEVGAFTSSKPRRLRYA